MITFEMISSCARMDYRDRGGSKEIKGRLDGGVDYGSGEDGVF